MLYFSGGQSDRFFCFMQWKTMADKLLKRISFGHFYGATDCSRIVGKHTHHSYFSCHGNIQVQGNHLPFIYPGKNQSPIPPCKRQCQLRTRRTSTRIHDEVCHFPSGRPGNDINRVLLPDHYDFIASKAPGHFDECLSQLSRLSARSGVYAVLRNHDHRAGPDRLKLVIGGLKEIGARVFRNQAVYLSKGNDKLILAGVDDHWMGPSDLGRTYRGMDREICTILLSHNPDINKEVESYNHQADLILCGHTHGGQIRLPLIGSPIPMPFDRRYMSGLIKDGARQTYVNRGLGVFFVPFRLNCPPEITILTLRGT